MIDLENFDRAVDLGFGNYIDWSTHEASHYEFEIGDDKQGIQVPMTRRMMQELRDRLTVTLMLDEA